MELEDIIATTGKSNTEGAVVTKYVVDHAIVGRALAGVTRMRE